MASRTIAFLTPLYFDERSCLGGGERHPLNLARGVALASGGRYRVELVSFGEQALTRPLGPGVDLRVLRVTRRPTHPLDMVSWDLPDAIAAADLLHIHQAFTRCAELGLLVGRQLRKPICVTDHGGFSSPMGEEVGALELADRVVPVSDFGASLIRTGRPVVVIKGGVDAEVFQPPEAPVERDRVLYVGRILPHKGIDRLIEALPPDLPLTVCGRPYHADYAARLQELAAGKRVSFVHDADDAAIRDLYRRAWVTVLPSVYRDCYGTVHRIPELMGFTLLESMACGTPAIASRVGGMPEFIAHGQTGYVFDEPAELRAHLEKLASDSGLVARLGRQAREHVLRHFDLRVAGARLSALYDELLGARRIGKQAAA